MNGFNSYSTHTREMYLKARIYKLYYMKADICPVLYSYSKKKVTPLTINFLYVQGNTKSVRNIVEQSRFLHKELSIRLSHRVIDLIRLPYGLSDIPNIKDVIGLYSDSFSRIQNSNIPESISDIDKFTSLLEDIKKAHINVEHDIFIGLNKLNNDSIDYNIINNNLDKFFSSRIGIRMLISQQVSVVNNNGSIIERCDTLDVITNAIQSVQLMATELYGRTPKINVYMENNIYFSYIPSNMTYIMVEILKNAVVSHQTNNILDKSIKIVVSEGERDISIKISDRGLGFPISHVDKVLTYSYTTTPIEIIEEYELGRIPIVSGFGFGLPMSRVYARYFGGDLSIMPMENYGTDIFLYINKLGNIHERLN